MSSSIGECQRNEAVLTCQPRCQLYSCIQICCTRAYGVDKPNTCEIHVVLRKFFDSVSVVYGFRSDVLVTCERQDTSYDSSPTPDFTWTYCEAGQNQRGMAESGNHPDPIHRENQQAQARRWTASNALRRYICTRSTIDKNASVDGPQLPRKMSYLQKTLITRAMESLLFVTPNRSRQILLTKFCVRPWSKKEHCGAWTYNQHRKFNSIPLP